MLYCTAHSTSSVQAGHILRNPIVLIEYSYKISPSRTDVRTQFKVVRLIYLRLQDSGSNKIKTKAVNNLERSNNY